MRGELDDALARMARMEELRRRAAEPATDHRSGLDELVEAVRRVVAQHPGVRVTLWAEDGTQGAGVRVEWSGGEVVVSTDQEPLPMPSAGAPPEPWPGAAVRSGLPAAGAPPDLPAAGAPPDLPSAAASGPGPELRPARLEPELPSAGAPPRYRSLPVSTPTAWVPGPGDDATESAARLAELIRRDPGLLHAPEDTDGGY